MEETVQIQWCVVDMAHVTHLKIARAFTDGLELIVPFQFVMVLMLQTQAYAQVMDRVFLQTIAYVPMDT